MADVKADEWELYVNEAASFDDDRVQRYRRSERRAWWITAAACVLALCGVGAVAALAPLKTASPPVVVMVDKSTGVVDVLTTLNGRQQVPVEDAERKYWLAKYVTYRESYAWADRATNFHATSLMSDKPEQQRYADWFSQSNADSPQRRFGDSGVVEIHILSVALGTAADASANVRFERIVHERNGDTQPPERWIATVTHRFVNGPIKEADRLINPRGFQVVAYRLDREIPR